MNFLGFLLILLSLSFSQVPFNQTEQFHTQNLFNSSTPVLFQFRGTSIKNISIRGQSEIKTNFFGNSQYITLSGVDYLTKDILNLKAVDSENNKFVNYIEIDEKFYFKTVEGEISLISSTPQYNSKPDFIEFQNKITPYSKSSLNDLITDDRQAQEAINSLSIKQYIFYSSSILSLATLISGGVLTIQSKSEGQNLTINPLVYIGMALTFISYFLQPSGESYQQPAQIFNSNLKPYNEKKIESNSKPLTINEAESSSNKIIYEEALEE